RVLISLRDDQHHEAHDRVSLCVWVESRTCRALPMRRTRCREIDNDRLQAVAQEQPSPDQCPDINREQDMTEEWRADPHVGEDGAAQKAGQQDGARDGRTWNEIDGQADELERSDPRSEVHWNTEAGERLHDRGDIRQLDDAVEQQKQDCEGAQETSGPEPLPRNKRWHRVTSLGVESRIPALLVRRTTPLEIDTGGRVLEGSGDCDSRPHPRRLEPSD